MKSILIQEDLYDKLMDISRSLNTQNHRCTRMPYMIQVSRKKEVSAYSGCGEVFWFSPEGEKLETKNEEDEVIKEHLYEKHGEGYIHAFNQLDEYDKESILEDLDFTQHEVTQEDELTNFFFTEKGLRDLYGKDVNTYLTGVRNPELETVMRFLCELSGGELHK